MDELPPSGSSMHYSQIAAVRQIVACQELQEDLTAVPR